ncbi:MAG: rod-binding protein [Rhizobiaceae bacterium]|nr:rod-binding protein [Rhizobiaceae bacterium]
MAISPPSDIVLDVAKAVDQAALETAKSQLVRRAGRSAAPGFSVDMPATAQATSTAEKPSTRGDLSTSTLAASRAVTPPDTFVRFEAMVLQSFVEAMLPKDSGSVYGDGMAGDMWKSLMAEEISGVMAKRGGIGIADQILRGHYYEGEQRVAMSGLSDTPAQATRAHANSVSNALVNELQRRLTSGLVSDTSSAPESQR